MKISAIRPSLFRGKEESVIQEKPVQIQKKGYQNIGLSGGLALAFLGTSAVTGIAHARVPHIVSSILAIGAALAHVESIAIKNNRTVDYNA